ncbi:MAG: Gfo/Idh/MocA family protein [Streptosporangiaceae bacterium]
MSGATELRVGVVGCGNISAAYARGLARIDGISLVACADVDAARAAAAARAYGLRQTTVSELLSDPSIAIVVNLTPPLTHAEVTLQALRAGKHVFTEKPLAATFAEAEAIVDEARRSGLVLGSAPDTFLGSAGQTARHLVNSGDLGEIVGASAFVTHSHAEMWHPDPTFLFIPGGGPSLDMGPYYIAALVNLLGPIRSVFSQARIGSGVRPVFTPDRTVSEIHVQIPTHCSAVITFASGVIGTVLMSFDVWNHELPHIELYGTKGTLSVPDPDRYDDVVRYRMHADAEWHAAEPAVPALTAGIAEADLPLRGPGVADLAGALAGRSQRCSADFALHVLEVLETIASGDGIPHDMTTTCERPVPLARTADIS